MKKKKNKWKRLRGAICINGFDKELPGVSSPPHPQQGDGEPWQLVRPMIRNQYMGLERWLSG